MPIYEFECSECGELFEELVFNLTKIGSVTCPSCQSDQVRKRISLMASTLRSNGGSAAPASSCTTSL
jgi:putative FmdB family regulatory protein